MSDQHDPNKEILKTDQYDPNKEILKTDQYDPNKQHGVISNALEV